MKGYTRLVTLTDDERDRLSGLLFSRGLIQLVFRACLDPATAARAAKKVAGLRRDSEAQAAELRKV